MGVNGSDFKSDSFKVTLFAEEAGALQKDRLLFTAQPVRAPGACRLRARLTGGTGVCVSGTDLPSPSASATKLS